VKQQRWGLLAKLGTAQKQKALRGLLYPAGMRTGLSAAAAALAGCSCCSALVAVLMLLLLARSLSLVVLAQWVSWAHSPRRASERVMSGVSGVTEQVGMGAE
jgi:hypothetical protein